MSSTAGVYGRATLNDEAAHSIAEMHHAIDAVGPPAQTRRLLAAHSALRTCADASEELFECQCTTAVGDLVNVTRTALCLLEITLCELFTSWGARTPAPPVTHRWGAETVLHELAVPLLRLGNLLWTEASSSRIRYVSEQVQRVAGDTLALTTKPRH
ncbi:hypothetical protein [Allokutzneria multivorans]